MREFDYYAPETLAEATALLTEHGAEARIIAGGTDLIIFMNDKVLAPQVVIDVTRIPDLTGLCFDPETGLRIGAATKYRTIELSAEVKQHYPYLQQGAEEVGSVQIRNLGTPGGNIATASPAGDFLTPLLAGAATARLASSRGERTVRSMSSSWDRARRCWPPTRSSLTCTSRLPRRARVGCISSTASVGRWTSPLWAWRCP